MDEIGVWEVGLELKKTCIKIKTKGSVGRSWHRRGKNWTNAPMQSTYLKMLSQDPF